MIRNHSRARGIAVRLLVVAFGLLLAATAGRWTRTLRGPAAPVREFAGRPVIWSVSHEFMVTGPKPRALSDPGDEFGSWTAEGGVPEADRAAASLRGFPLILGGPRLWPTLSNGRPTSRAPPESLLPEP